MEREAMMLEPYGVPGQDEFMSQREIQTYQRKFSSYQEAFYKNLQVKETESKKKL
jgi:hypothetical protein